MGVSARAVWESKADDLIEAVRASLAEDDGREPTEKEVPHTLDNCDVLWAYAGGHYELLRDGAEAEVVRLIAALRMERGR